MSALAPVVLTSQGVGQVTLDAARRFFAWLGAVTLGLVERASVMIGQGNAEMAQIETTSQFGAPAILMAGGLATLAVLFAIMLVRKNPATASTGPPGASHGAGPAATQAAGGPREATTTPQTAAAVEPADRASGHPAARTSDGEVPVMTAEVDDTDEEVTLALSTAGSLGTSNGGSSQRSKGNGRAAMVDQGSSRVLAASNAEHQELLKRGRQAGAGFDGDTLHQLMEHMRETGLAEPRLLKTVPHLVRLRLIHCRGCTAGSETNVEGVARCPFEEGFLEGAFKQIEGDDVVVREIACRQRGDPGCDFEVWF